MNEPIPNATLTKKQRRELRRQEKLAERHSRASSRTIRRVLIWVGALALVGLTIWGLIRAGSGSVPPESIAPVDQVTDQDWVRGNVNALATLVEYSDFQCPACGAFYPYVKNLEKDFGANLRVVYRHFPLPQHANGRLAAAASEAAGAQGKFWEMHDRLFDNQTAWSEDSNAAEVFTEYAANLGLDTDKFKTDLESNAITTRVSAGVASGNKAGVNSTPTFFLNGRRLELRNFNDLRTKVEAAIQELVK